MMVQPVVSRSQRRVERKQLLLIVVLILAVAGVSFSLGVIFGRKSAPAQALIPGVEKTNPGEVTQVAPPPPPQTEIVPEKPEKLTFYDNLPKGNQAPLGSGINLPPEQPKKPAQVKTKSSVKQAKPPQTVSPEVSKSPRPSAEGSFIVQIASFRTSEDAKKLATRLKDYNLLTFVEAADLGEKGKWYRVLAGPYSSREGAGKAASLLKEKERLSALVRQR